MVIYAEKDRIITKNEKFRIDPAEKSGKSQKQGGAGRRKISRRTPTEDTKPPETGSGAGEKHTQARRDTSHNMQYAKKSAQKRPKCAFYGLFLGFWGNYRTGQKNAQKRPKQRSKRAPKAYHEEKRGITS